jgi:hypothetical protein
MTIKRLSIIAGAVALLGVSDAEAIIGRPLTPFSYAGVARRTTRRAAYFGGYAGAAYPYAYPGMVTALPPSCVAAPPMYTCGAASYRAYYDGPTVVYRPY